MLVYSKNMRINYLCKPLPFTYTKGNYKVILLPYTWLPAIIWLGKGYLLMAGIKIGLDNFTLHL